MKPSHLNTSRAAGALSAALFGVLLLSACGTYEPPKPGTYTEIGSSKAEYACGIETPTATRFSVTRCRNIADAKARGEANREAADSIRTPPPDVRSR